MALEIGGFTLNIKIGKCYFSQFFEMFSSTFVKIVEYGETEVSQILSIACCN